MSVNVLRDACVALLFGALALAALFFLIPTGVQAPGSIEQAALSPAFWPKVIAWATLVASVMLLVEAIGAARTQAPKPEAEADGPLAEDHTVIVGLLRAIGLILLLFAFYRFLDRYGIVVPSIVLLPLIMLYFGERKAVTIGAVSLGLPVLLYLFFRYVAGISIPLGIFG